MDDRLLFDKPNNDRRTVIDETSFNWFGIEYFNIVEDISRPTDWQLQFGTHSLVVHLDGQLKLFESTVENGYGTKKLPLLGEILFVPADYRYAAKAWGNQVEYAEIRFDPKSIYHLLGIKHGNLDFKALVGIRDEFIHVSAKKLSHLVYHNDDLSIMSAKSLMVSICSYFASRYSVNSTINYIEDNLRIPRIKQARLEQYINDHIGSRIKIETLAAMTGLLPRTFLFAFRKAFGMTPTQYIIKQRIVRARELLSATSMGITEVALITGFSSHAHLTRAFKYWIGVTPSEYRRTIK